MNDHKKSIAAGIVLFNPGNDSRINESINSVLSQVDAVYVFDNSTEAHDDLFPAGVTCLTENGNKGIAYAMNRIMEMAERDGYEWLVTMDQDSVLPSNTISMYSAYTDYDSDIAIICPQVIDVRRSYMTSESDKDIEYIDFCITSASCTRISAWRDIGGFDEILFIDLVDNEFCKRLTVSGYKILRLNSLVLNQEFGEIYPKSEKVQKFWNKVANVLGNVNFAKFGYRKVVSSLRVYYTHRNIIYVNRKLSLYGRTGFNNYNCKGFPGFVIAFTAPSILRAQDKIGVISAVFRGVRDGLKMHPEKWRAKS